MYVDGLIHVAQNKTKIVLGEHVQIKTSPLNRLTYCINLGKRQRHSGKATRSLNQESNPGSLERTRSLFSQAICTLRAQLLCLAPVPREYN
jgi:hypothetical protein